MLVSIVIPCYNSEHTIEKVVDLTMEEFKKLDGYECEMVLVNDYSKDRTFDAISRAAKKYSNVTAVNLAKNFGQQAAIMAGLHYINGDLIVGMDDDLQNHPSQIKEFLEKEKEGYDVVFGDFKERHFSAFKNFTSKIQRKILFKMIDRPKDIQMGSFWLAKRFVVDKALEYESNSSFVQLLFFRTTHNIVNIEIEHFDRQVGSSNYTFRKALKLFMSMLNYSELPLKFATYLGAFFSFVGVIAALVVFIMKLVNPALSAGWPSLMCAIMFFFGVTFLILGILGEYIGRTLFAVNRSPQYVVRDVIRQSGAVLDCRFNVPIDQVPSANTEPDK